MQRLAREENLETLESKDGAKPRVYYKNNHLFDTCFVGGTVITQDSGQEECVEGALVKAMKDEKEIGHAKSDAFGDFKIEKLTPNLGAITLHIAVADKPDKTIDVELSDSIYIGCIEV
jgi:hypothetical protein